MSTVERSALLRGLEIHDQVHELVDERTLEIVERRRRTSVVHGRGWLLKRLLVTADVFGLVCAMLVAELAAATTDSRALADLWVELLVIVASLPAWVVLAKVYGLYDRDEVRTDHSTSDEFVDVFHMVTVCTWALWAFSRITSVVNPTAEKLLVFWALAVTFVTVGRVAARIVARRRAAFLQNAIIVGAGDVGQLIARKLLQHPEYGINLIGFIDGEPRDRPEGLEHIAILGNTSRLPAIARLLDVERVIIAFSNESPEETARLVRQMAEMGLQVDIVPRLFEFVGPILSMHVVEGLPLVGVHPLRLTRSSSFLKRAMDVVVAITALIALAPVMLVLAAVVKLDSRGPVLYRHKRVGRSRDPIEVWKFRTMRLEACRGDRYGGADAEAAFAALLEDPEKAREFEATYKLERDPRVTRVGGFLRRASLDELPQLFNVLFGHLSLVGPRAVTEDELDRYGEHVSSLLAVRPGVTGYWQVNGRSRLGYEDRVRLDVAYVQSWSLGLDLKILARTLRVLSSATGAY